MGALDEAKRMKDIVQMHMEAAEDAEARAKKYKDLLETVTSNNKELMQKRPPPRKSLDAAAEALLKDMQNTLDRKLSDLALQREELEKAQESERTIASEFQALARETEGSKRIRDQALARVAATEKENAELKKRVATLEERILMAASPHPSMGTPALSDYGGNRTTPRMASRRLLLNENRTQWRWKRIQWPSPTPWIKCGICSRGMNRFWRRWQLKGGK